MWSLRARTMPISARPSWQDAKLLHHRERLDDMPVLGQPPVLQAMDVDAGEGDRAARRRNAHYVALVRPRHRPIHSYHVVLRDDAMKCVLGMEPGEDGSDPKLQPLDPAGLAG